MTSAERPEPEAVDLGGVAGLVLDVDGTLIDSVYERTLAWKRAFATVSAHPPTWRLHRLVGRDGRAAVREIAAGLGADWSEAEVAEIRRRYEAAYAQSSATVRPLPGARDLVRALDASGRRWAIATTASRAATEDALRVLGGVRPHAVVAGDEVVRGKPDPEIVRTAAARLGLTAPEVAFVGDTVWDVMAARACGADAIGVLSGGWSREELRAAGARIAVTGVVELVTALQGTRSY